MTETGGVPGASDDPEASGMGAGIRPLPPSSRVRRRVRRSVWSRFWLYVRHGPPAELLQSLVLLVQPSETFRNSHGPWHRGLVVARERRSRKRRSPIVRYLRQESFGEAWGLFASLVRRHSIALTLGVAAVVWWYWPWWRPQMPVFDGAATARPKVVTVFVEDPQRVVTALTLWKTTPGSTLVLQGRPISQADIRRYFAARGIALEESPRLVTLLPGCDTLGQLTTLSQWLRRYPQPGELTVVTSPAHLPRSLAIAEIVVGVNGWKVQGLAAVTGDNRPEEGFRLVRDQLRGQLWRLTGWDPAAALVCSGRARGLF